MTTTALEAFGHMARDRRSSLGITDTPGGKLISNLSVSDLRGLTADDFPLLLLPVGEFILVRQGLASKADALEGKHVQVSIMHVGWISQHHTFW